LITRSTASAAALTLSRSRDRTIIGISCQSRQAAERYKSTALVGVDALFCCATTKSPNGCQLPLLRPAPGKGSVSEDVQILTQQLDRRAGISSCRTSHDRQPIIRPGKAPCVAIDWLLGSITM
jgi:hypothetical protein